MHKLLMILVVMMMATFGSLSVVHAAVDTRLGMHQKMTPQHMQTLRVMISKLRDLVYNLRDINQLAEIGMPRRDVALMKQALQLKINQMQQETVSFIRGL